MLRLCRSYFSLKASVYGESTSFILHAVFMISGMVLLFHPYISTTFAGSLMPVVSASASAAITARFV